MNFRQRAGNPRKGAAAALILLAAGTAGAAQANGGDEQPGRQG